MAEIRPGDAVIVQTAGGAKVPMRALSAVVKGAKFPIVWVSPAEEPDRRIPWPAEYVHPAATSLSSRNSAPATGDQK